MARYLIAKLVQGVYRIEFSLHGLREGLARAGDRGVVEDAPQLLNAVLAALDGSPAPGGPRPTLAALSPVRWRFGSKRVSDSIVIAIDTAHAPRDGDELLLKYVRWRLLRRGPLPSRERARTIYTRAAPAEPCR
jgi:hypothetical protein